MEVLVTIGILSILAAVATPLVGRALSRSRLQSEARDLLAAMRWAKSEAVSQAQSVSIVFTEGTGAAGSYTIFIDDDEDYTLDGGETLLRQITMPADINLYDADFNPALSCGFDNRGMSRDARTGSVRLSNANSPPFFFINLRVTGSTALQSSAVQ